MGHVIRVDNQGGAPPSVLTEIGTGGFLSSGYLRDRPAIARLEDEETPVFVLTNESRGVEITRDGERERITAGSGYRTIAVVTDRRILVVVGDSGAESIDGDQSLTVQFVDVESVTTDGDRRGGTLTVRRASGGTIAIHGGADGLDEVAAYVEAAAQAWVRVENALDEIKRSLVTATGHCDGGEYDAALAAATDAYHGLSDPRLTANRFDAEWEASALVARVDQVQRRCAGMLAEVRRGRARRFSDDAEARWRDGEFEAARDAYDSAREELETVLTYDSAAVDDRADVQEALDRVERVSEELAEAPLRRAIEADRAASDADEPADAAAHWAEALDAYGVVLELDWGADERRFAGEPERIRERLGTVVERFVSARQSAATKTKRAGDWYVGAEQYGVAIDEFEAALDQYDRALAVARERYPDATDHLMVERDAVESRLERAQAMRDGKKVGAIEPPGNNVGGEPAHDVAATIGDDEASAPEPAEEVSEAIEVAPERSAADDPAADGEEASDVEARLRALDERALTDLVLRVLAETGWTATRGGADDAYDVEATRGTPTDERMLVLVAARADDGGADRSAIDDCAALRRERPDVDATMVATAGSLSADGARHARERSVRLFEGEYLSAIVESRDLADAVPDRPMEAD